MTSDNAAVETEGLVLVLHNGLAGSANRVYAFALACPHEHAAVKWLAKDHRFQCTKYDSQYTPDGKYTSGKATRNLDRFPIRKQDSMVIVTTDRVFQSDQNAPAWNEAGIDV